MNSQVQIAIDDKFNYKILILAAGKSERFKSIKLLAPVDSLATANSIDDKKTNSTPLIQHAINKVSQSLSMLNINQNNLYVATGIYHEKLVEFIEPQYSIIECSDSHLGLGHTIAQAVTSIVNEKENTSHIMITLADQIALQPDDYIKLIEQSLLHPDKLICSQAGGKTMPPAIFPKQYFSQLLELTGDKGAKTVLNKNNNNLHKITIPSAVIDIDTKQDLVNWQNNSSL